MGVSHPYFDCDQDMVILTYFDSEDNADFSQLFFCDTIWQRKFTNTQRVFLLFYKYLKIAHIFLCVILQQKCYKAGIL